jgi:hypothetical protein
VPESYHEPLSSSILYLGEVIMQLNKFRVSLIVVVLFAALSAAAQERANKQAPAHASVKEFTQQQLDDLRTLSNQMALADCYDLYSIPPSSQSYLKFERSFDKMLL